MNIKLLDNLSFTELDTLLRNDAYVPKCSKCIDTKVAMIKNNHIFIFSYKSKKLELFIPKYFIEIETVLKNIFKLYPKFKTTIYSNMDKRISKDVMKMGWNCPSITMISKMDFVFKNPVLTYEKGVGIKSSCTSERLIDKLMSSNTSGNINFSNKDILFFKSLLNRATESGGEIEKYGNRYRIKMDSIVYSNDTFNLTLEPCAINFHTHPYIVYKDELSLGVAWFSGLDFEYIIYNSLNGLKEHFLITSEGIYHLKLTTQFIKFFKQCTFELQDKYCDLLKLHFANVENQRKVPKKHVMKMDKCTIHIFTHFVTHLNSLNSSFFKNPDISEDFILFDLNFMLF
jgi:hypothetical protein